MEAEEIEFAYLEGALRALTNNIDEQFGGKYRVTFTIERVAAGGMG